MKIKILLTLTSLMAAAQFASAADNAELWAKNCASCHAKDGTGNTIMGKKSGVDDYTDAKFQAKFTDAEGLAIIKNGKGKMKGFADKLTDPEIKAMLAYVRAFKK